MRSWRVRHAKACKDRLTGTGTHVEHINQASDESDHKRKLFKRQSGTIGLPPCGQGSLSSRSRSCLWCLAWRGSQSVAALLGTARPEKERMRSGRDACCARGFPAEAAWAPIGCQVAGLPKAPITDEQGRLKMLKLELQAERRPSASKTLRRTPRRFQKSAQVEVPPLLQIHNCGTVQQRLARKGVVHAQCKGMEKQALSFWDSN